ncbi:MAG: hypothetical protein QW607_00805 [Desulfurococcaceae archaeon]
MLGKFIKKQNKEKTVIDIYYDPRENPEIELYFISEDIAAKDSGLSRANERMRFLQSEIYQIVKYVGFEPEVVIKTRYITELGKPHFVPCIYLNGVLIGTVYTIKLDRILNLLKEMKKLRDEYYNKLFKDINMGYIMYPNEHYIHVRNPLYVNWIVNSKDAAIAQRFKIPTMSIDPFDEIPATFWLVNSLRRQGVPVTPVGFATETKYKVLVMPERRYIEI